MKDAYVYGNYDERLTRDHIQNDNPTESGHRALDTYLYDGRGSVSQVTNEQSNIVGNQQYRYDPFGNMIQNKPDNEIMFGYNGEEYNPITDTQYLRARYYDVGMSRFISKDTDLGDTQNPSTRNLYAYTANDPVNHKDPSGNYIVDGDGNRYIKSPNSNTYKNISSPTAKKSTVSSNIQSAPNNQNLSYMDQKKTEAELYNNKKSCNTSKGKAKNSSTELKPAKPEKGTYLLTPLDYQRVANIAYHPSKSSYFKAVNGDKWVYLDNGDTFTELQEIAFVPEKQKEKGNIKNIVIGFAGTDLHIIKHPLDTIGDVLTDIVNVAGGVHTVVSQFNDAVKFAGRLISRYSKAKVSITGHSLGGSIAKYVGLRYPSIRKIVTFSAAPVTPFLNRTALVSGNALKNKLIEFYHKNDPIGDSSAIDSYLGGSRIAVAGSGHGLNTYKFDKTSGNIIG